jgi:hypothetical protein
MAILEITRWQGSGLNYIRRRSSSVFCTIHPEREASGNCISCGDSLCEECIAVRDGTRYMCRMCELLYTAILLESWGVPSDMTAGDDELL